MRLRRMRLDDERDRRWVVAGPHGAIEYHEIITCDMAAGIEVHSPVPQRGADTPQPCPILEGPCYVDGSGMAAELQQRYRTAGDEDLIWAELEHWYTTELQEVTRR